MTKQAVSPKGPPSRHHQSYRGGGRHWERWGQSIRDLWNISYVRWVFDGVCSLSRPFRGRGDHPSAHIQAVPPPAPIPPSFPAQSMYPPPLQAYPPPYSSGPGLVPPPPVNYQPQAVYGPGPGVLNPPWVAPGNQPPLVSLPGSLSQPPLSKDDFYRPRHHRQDKWVFPWIWVNFEFKW